MSNLTAFETWIGNGTSFNNTVADSQGLHGLTGTPLIMGIFALAIVVGIIAKTKPTMDLSLLLIITMMEIIAGVYLPDWIKWFFIIIGGCFLGFGLIKMKKGG